MGQRKKSKRLTLSQYVKRRNGVSLGGSGSLYNMLNRSLGAGTFAGFWQYWNPIWGFYLARLVFIPLKKFLPKLLAMIITFVVSGLIHDIVISIVRGNLFFVFTPWFFLLGGVAAFAQVAGLNFSKYTWLFRACVNLIYLFSCLFISKFMVHNFFTNALITSANS